MEWPRVELGKVAEIRGGSTPRRNNPAYWNGDIPWLTPTDLPANATGVTDVIATEHYITEEGLSSCSATLLPPGTVLFSSRASIGKVAVAAVPLATNQGFANLIPRPLVDSRYLAWCLHFHAEQIAGLAGSTTFKEVSKGSLRRFSIPLPPLSEQRRIVEILDHADRLRRLCAEADAKTDRIVPALFIKMFGDPATNPMGWPVLPLGQLLTPIQTRNPCDRSDEAFTYIDISGVDGQSGEILDTRRLLGADAPSRARQVVQVGDVLVSTVRPYLRATAMVTPDLDGQICSTGFCVLRSHIKGAQSFLYVLSRTSWFTEQLTARARGASYPAVTDSDVRGLHVPFPSDSASLVRFGQVVDALLKQRRERREATTRMDDLFTSLVSRAFSGSLTASWREAHMKELLHELEQQGSVLAEMKT